MRTNFRLVLTALLAAVPAAALFPRAALAQSDRGVGLLDFGTEHDDDQLPALPPAPPGSDDEVNADADAAPPDARPPAQPPDRQTFEERLSPYGRWVDTPDYARVWIPSDVSQDWQPYTDGRWVDTDQGWSFASDVPWGWAAFHYGRWGFGADLGWYWVPGFTWSPAWVSWRWQGGYACWSPYAPAGFRFGNRWPGWVAVPRTHFTSPITRYAVSRGQVGPIVRAAQPVRGVASARAAAAGTRWNGARAGGVAQRGPGSGGAARSAPIAHAAPGIRSGTGYARSWSHNGQARSWSNNGSAGGGWNRSYARSNGYPRGGNSYAHGAGGGFSRGSGGSSRGGGGSSRGGGSSSHGGGGGSHGGGGGSHGGGGGSHGGGGSSHGGGGSSRGGGSSSHGGGHR